MTGECFRVLYRYEMSVYASENCDEDSVAFMGDFVYHKRPRQRHESTVYMVHKRSLLTTAEFLYEQYGANDSLPAIYTAPCCAEEL